MGGSKTYVTHKNVDADLAAKCRRMRSFYSWPCALASDSQMGWLKTHPFSLLFFEGGAGRGSRREGTVAFVTNYSKRSRVGVGVRAGGGVQTHPQGENQTDPEQKRERGRQRSDRVGQRGGRGREGAGPGGEGRIRKQEVPLSCELQGESEI